MKKQEKYFYLGYAHPNVPNGWISIVNEMLKKIDNVVRPWYIPLSLLNLINTFATDGSVVYVKSWFWYKILNHITKGVKITDIKDKYAELRVYAFSNDKVDKIIEWAENECEKTCEICGSKADVKISGKNWFYNLCLDCRLEKGIEETQLEDGSQ